MTEGIYCSGIFLTILRQLIVRLLYCGVFGLRHIIVRIVSVTVFFCIVLFLFFFYSSLLFSSLFLFFRSYIPLICYFSVCFKTFSTGDIENILNTSLIWIYRRYKERILLINFTFNTGILKIMERKRDGRSRNYAIFFYIGYRCMMVKV